MKILDIRAISGPSLYHHRPVLIMTIDLEKFTDVPSCDIEGLNQSLLNLLPGLYQHQCSPGYEGGFNERLERGTYFAHIIEHIALELSELSGHGVDYGKSIYDGAHGRYNIVVRSKQDETMIFLLKSAVKLLEELACGRSFDLQKCIDEAKKINKEYCFGPSTLAILEAADKKNIPWLRLNNQALIQLGQGHHRRFIDATTSGLTSDIAVDVAQDKWLTKKLLMNASIKVPYGKSTSEFDEAIRFAEEIGWPLAVKPIDGNHGRGVSTNVVDLEGLHRAFVRAKEHCETVLIEESLLGKDHRLLIVGGKMIAAAERVPAHVHGDGTRSIRELIALINQDPERGEGHENFLTKIEINDETLNVLKRANLSLDYVPKEDEFIFLKDTANLSTGATAIDCTDRVHPEIKMTAERASRIIGLDICGIDFIAEDISRPMKEQSCGIIEVNAGPGIRMHQHPSEGKVRDVGGAIINYLYPDSNARVPIVSITGTNGKTTVSRLLSHVVALSGQRVGNTTTDGIFIDDQQIVEGDTTGPISARTVLSDPLVEVAILETARGGISKRGLGYDWSDVGIFTNLKQDHLGQDSMETMDDILRAKSLVIERVRDGGDVILNADSKEILGLLNSPRCRIENKRLTLFSLRSDNPTVLKHLALRGHAYFIREGHIVEAQGNYESNIVHLNDVPLTFGGSADFHSANIMAAIAGAHALNLDDEVILRALMTFDQEQNKGRTNLYKIPNGYFLLDYGHNPDALKSIGLMCRKWRTKKLTAIVTCPGDRSDALIKQIGVTAALYFDKIIVREDIDLRGRKSGEVAQMIKEAVQITDPSRECHVIFDSKEALLYAFNNCEENELIIYFYETWSRVVDELQETRLEKWHDFTFFNATNDHKKIRGDEWLQYSF